MIDDGGDKTVIRDMERVFAGIGETPRFDRQSGIDVPKRPSPALRHGARTTWTAAAGLVATAGLAVVVLPRSDRSMNPAPAPTVRAASAPAPVTGSDPDAALRSAAGSAPVAHERLAGRSASPPTVHPTTSGHERRTISPAKATKSASTKSRPSTGKEPAAPERSSTPRADPYEGLPCQRAMDQVRCFYDEVVRADLRLRRAYDAAAAANVPASDMRRAHRTWKRALSRSRKEPLVSVGTINGLTNSLRNSIRTSRERAE